MKRNILLILLLALAMFSLTACVSEPEMVITSKNDGTFENAITETEPGSSNSLASSPERVEADFTSTDGSVNIMLDVSDAAFIDGKLPVIRITPHEITGGDAEEIANIIFNGADIYEDPSLDGSGRYSVEQLEQMIIELQYLATDEGYAAAYGEESLSDTSMKEEIQRNCSQKAENYKKQLQAGTAGAEKCQWTFYSLGHYLGDEILSDGSEVIHAMTTVNGNDYLYWVTKHTGDDYRIQNIHVNIDETVARIAFRGSAYSLQEATEDQLSAVCGKADALAAQLGEWQRCDCEAVATTLPTMEEAYMIQISYIPVYNGIPVTYQPQLTDLRSDSQYASNYYYTALSMEYSNDGTLLGLSYISPVDVVETVNENVPVVEYKDVIDKIKTSLTLTDAASYENPYQDIYDAVSADVIVNDLEVGLSRINIPNEDDFYLVPSITVRGFYRLYDQDGALIYDSSGSGEQETFLTANLVDNTTINTALGY